MASVVFAGVGKDCGIHLPKVFQNLERQAELFSNVGYIFVENDSEDNTKARLQSWGSTKKNFHLLNMDGVAQIATRTVRLELLRNICIQYIRSNTTLSSFDYLVLLDMDEVSTQEVDLGKIQEAINFLSAKDSRAAVFPNQLGAYYDMWALRHGELCPGDAWEAVLDCVQEKKISDAEAFAETFGRRIFSIPLDGGYIEVDSAFGGLGIYKMKYVLNNLNPYLGSKVKILKGENDEVAILRLQTCEHVHFNLGIKSLGGQLFIKSDLINSTNDGINFPPSYFRTIIF